MSWVQSPVVERGYKPGFNEQIRPADLFRTNAHSGKKTFVYLFLDASHIESLDICDIDEAIPPSTMNAFSKRASGASSEGIMVLRFDMKCHAPLITPDSTLQKRPTTCEDLEALLRVGQCETFKVYVLSSAVNRARLSSLSSALAGGALQPAPEGVISNLYVNTSYRKVTCIDQLWGSVPTGNPPPYDPSTAPGASNDESSGPSDPQPLNSSRPYGKRRSISPAVHQTPSKRQLLTEKPVIEPWQLAIAAQGAQIAALSAELSALREQVQQLKRAPGVDAGTQTDPVVEHEPECTPGADLVSSPVYSPVYSPAYQPVYSSVYPPVYPPVSRSPTSTVEDTIDERLAMLEENRNERLTKLEQEIVDEKTQRSKLDERIVQNNKLLHENLELESCSLHLLVETLTSRILDLESEICDDLRKEFEDSIDAKGLDLQVKLEEFCEHRLEDVEEVVKQDVRIAFEHSQCKINLGWPV
ncbi:hypothetical protein E4T44_03904 [Aureobasidium sp. EXF-8845]|nr:hypothetical protein E4T44_03904 [Aureobasidium sp. EXF-8845]